MVVMSYFVSSACLLFHSSPRLKRGNICITAYLAYKRFSNTAILGTKAYIEIINEIVMAMWSAVCI